MGLARVQGTGRVRGNSTPSVALTFATPPAVGNGIVVEVINYGNATPPAAGCADNRNPGTYTRAIQVQFPTSFSAAIYVLPIVTVSAAPFTVTVTYPTAGYFEAAAIEVSGVGTGLSVDQVAAQSGSGLTPATPATPALTAAEVFVAAVHAASGNQTAITVEAVSPSWTQEFENLDFSATIAGEGDWRVLTGAAGTTTSGSWTLSASTTWAAAIAAFKAGGATGGGMGAYSDRVIADGASHYWRLNEPSGTVAADSIAGGANAPGTISGGVTLGQPGPLADGSTAMVFNGTTGKIATALAVTLPITVTLEAWVKPSGSGPRTILGDYPAAAGGALSLFLDAANLLAVYSTVPGAYVGGLTALGSGLWWHVAMVLNGTVGVPYVNGVADNTPVALARNQAATDVVYIGAYTNNTTWFNGALAEVAIYPTALTAPQIAAHYALRTATGGGGGSPAFPWPLALVLGLA